MNSSLGQVLFSTSLAVILIGCLAPPDVDGDEPTSATSDRSQLSAPTPRFKYLPSTSGNGIVLLPSCAPGFSFDVEDETKIASVTATAGTLNCEDVANRHICHWAADIVSGDLTLVATNA